jgi:hypothetical protein
VKERCSCCFVGISAGSIEIHHCGPCIIPSVWPCSWAPVGAAAIAVAGRSSQQEAMAASSGSAWQWLA